MVKKCFKENLIIFMRIIFWFQKMKKAQTTKMQLKKNNNEDSTKQWTTSKKKLESCTMKNRKRMPQFINLRPTLRKLVLYTELTKKKPKEN